MQVFKKVLGFHKAGLVKLMGPHELGDSALTSSWLLRPLPSWKQHLELQAQDGELPSVEGGRMVRILQGILLVIWMDKSSLCALQDI